MAYPDQSATDGGFPPVGNIGNQDPKKDAARRIASDAGDRAKDVTDNAKREAAEVADTAKAAGTDVADTAKREAGNVAHEAGQQSRRVLDEGISELKSQAGAGQQRLAEMARSYGSELQSMTKNSEQSGPVTDLASSAQRVFDDAANWLERTEPADVLDSVRRFASRNPWQFLAISAGVGFVGARIVRGLKSSADDQQQPAPVQDHASPQPQIMQPPVMQHQSTPGMPTSVPVSDSYDTDGYPRSGGTAGPLGGDPDVGMAPGIGLPADPYPRGGGAGGL